MARKYGPPDGKSGDANYAKHMAWCLYHKREVDWETYLVESRKCSYGPPGSRSCDAEYRAHKSWCSRCGDVSWEAYDATRKAREKRRAADGDDISPEAIARRVEANREILRRRGLLAA